MPITDRSSPASSSYSEASDAGSPLLDALHQSERTRDVLKTVMKSRKSWKSLKDGEVVWPPELEVALLEGLENYVPQDTRETRILGRFPMRNRFISEYIYKKTGKRRTAKQVGSRIQQLRDTCGSKQVLQLLRPFLDPAKAPRRSSSPTSRKETSRSSPLPLRCDTKACSDTSSVSSPTELSPSSYDDESLARDNAVSTLLNVIYIDLVAPNGDLGKEDMSKDWDAPSCHQTAAVNYVQISQQPRHLRCIDPTVTMLSKTPIEANSFFTVSIQDTVVFSEATTLVLAGPLNDSDVDGPFLYRTTLVPGYWETISNCANPTRYTIKQKVYQSTCATSTPPLFSAVYKFRFAQDREVACPSQPHQQPSKISQSTIDGGLTTLQQSYPSSDYSPFNIPAASFDVLDTLISLDEDDMLAEFESLRMQPASQWTTNSPNALSSSSLSAHSSPHISVSPASSRLSATPPICSSLMPSPTLYPVCGVHYLAPGLDTIQNTQTDKAGMYLEPGFFPQDFFDSSFMLDATYNIHNQ